MAEEFNIETLPAWEANNFYSKIAHMAERYFSIPENQKWFEEWLEKKKEKEKKNGQNAKVEMYA